MRLICIIHQNLTWEHKRKLCTIHWKQARGVGRGLGSPQCWKPWISGRRLFLHRIQVRKWKHQTCRPWGCVCIGVGTPCVVGACTLSFPSACELCRGKGHAIPWASQSSQPRAWAEEPQTAYNSPFRNPSLITHQSLFFPVCLFF